MAALSMESTLLKLEVVGYVGTVGSWYGRVGNIFFRVQLWNEGS